MVTTQSAFSQFFHHIELGGSNFTGISLTTEYRIKLYKAEPGYQKNLFHLSPKVGVGHVFYWDHALTLQAGIGFGKILKKRNMIEFNSNVSLMTKSPILPNEDRESYILRGPQEEGNFFWYTGIDYKINGEKLTYTIGAGAITLITRPSFVQAYYISGDFIPILKLGVGL